MSSSLEQIEVQEIIQGLFIQQCIQVAICSVLVYDSLITMDKEAKYFWNNRCLTITHSLYFINRYGGILAALSALPLRYLTVTTTLCKTLINVLDLIIHDFDTLGNFSEWTWNIGDVLIVSIIDFILAIRVAALWGNNKTMTLSLKAVIICEAIVKVVILVRGLTVENYQATTLAPGMTFCSVNTSIYGYVANLGLGDWLMQLVIGFMLLVLALYKAVGQWRSSGLKRVDLLSIIIKDQIIYYFMVLFCSIINILGYKLLASKSTAGIYAFKILGSPSFLCLFGSRLFINLKEAGETEVIEGISNTAYRGLPLSKLRFATPFGPPSGDQVNANDKIQSTAFFSSDNSFTMSVGPSLERFTEEHRVID